MGVRAGIVTEIVHHPSGLVIVCVCVYLEVPNGHCSINACGAELATIPFVSLIDRHLAKDMK